MLVTSSTPKLGDGESKELQSSKRMKLFKWTKAKLVEIAKVALGFLHKKKIYCRLFYSHSSP